MPVADSDPRPPSRSWGHRLPKGYILGPRDELKVHFFASQPGEEPLDLTTSVEVDPNCYIFLPRIGRVDVFNRFVDQLQSELVAAGSVQFPGLDVSILVTWPRIDPGYSAAVEKFVLRPQDADDAYSITMGDTITLHLIGTGLEEHHSLVVDANGRIQVPRCGEIRIEGTRRDELDKKLLLYFQQHSPDVRVYTSTSRSPGFVEAPGP